MNSTVRAIKPEPLIPLTENNFNQLVGKDVKDHHHIETIMKNILFDRWESYLEKNCYEYYPDYCDHKLHYFLAKLLLGETYEHLIAFKEIPHVFLVEDARELLASASLFTVKQYVEMYQQLQQMIGRDKLAFNKVDEALKKLPPRKVKSLLKCLDKNFIAKREKHYSHWFMGMKQKIADAEKNSEKLFNALAAKYHLTIHNRATLLQDFQHIFYQYSNVVGGGYQQVFIDIMAQQFLEKKFLRLSQKQTFVSKIYAFATQWSLGKAVYYQRHFLRLTRWIEDALCTYHEQK